MQNLKVGDNVIVVSEPLWSRENRLLDSTTFPRHKGVIEFVSDTWCTVLVTSNTTKEPAYRKAFWKEQISLARKRRARNDKD